MSLIKRGFSYMLNGLNLYKTQNNWVNDLKNSVSDEIKINWLKNYLIDKDSKEVLDSVISYRKTHKHQYLFDSHTMYICNQYLIPEYMNYAKKGEVHVDCGVYNGETIYLYIKEMEKRGLMPQRIIGFEPNNLNEYYSNLILSNMLNDYELSVVEILKRGVSDATRSARLTMDGSCSKVCESGGQYTSLMRLDDIETKIDSIKMDLEGHEIPALKGAERHIKEENPRLAICVYHKPNDIWDIPKTILDMNPNYKFYLRQHFAGTCADNELVLYGVVPNGE